MEPSEIDKMVQDFLSKVKPGEPPDGTKAGEKKTPLPSQAKVAMVPQEELIHFIKLFPPESADEQIQNAIQNKYGLYTSDSIKELVKDYKKYQCPLCDVVLDGYAAATTHLMEHPGAFTVQCGICGLLFADGLALTNHALEKHDKVPALTEMIAKQFTCEFCGKAFGNAADFLKHLNQQHKNIVDEMTAAPKSKPTLSGPAKKIIKMYEALSDVEVMNLKEETAKAVKGFLKVQGKQKTPWYTHEEVFGEKPFTEFKKKFWEVFTVFIESLGEISVPDAFVVSKTEDGGWEINLPLKEGAIPESVSPLKLPLPQPSHDASLQLMAYFEILGEGLMEVVTPKIEEIVLKQLKELTVPVSDLKALTTGEALGDIVKAPPPPEVSYFHIKGISHQYLLPKGVLMHFKQSWKGDPVARLVKWALKHPKSAKSVTVHFTNGHQTDLFTFAGVKSHALAIH